MTILILPGIGNSGPEHWQSLWEGADPALVRVRQRDWDHPRCEEWVQALEAQSVPGAVLVAHSLACLVVARWAQTTRKSVRAAMLVAVPDPAGAQFPKEAAGFAQLPGRAFAFPSVVVASSDDPYGSLEHARACSRAWGSRLVEVGALGHINAASGLGDWPQGRRILASLREARE
jgi:predicted alpha/beta hydrolase family esterase